MTSVNSLLFIVGVETYTARRWQGLSCKNNWSCRPVELRAFYLVLDKVHADPNCSAKGKKVRFLKHVFCNFTIYFWINSLCMITLIVYLVMRSNCMHCHANYMFSLCEYSVHKNMLMCTIRLECKLWWLLMVRLILCRCLHE